MFTGHSFQALFRYEALIYQSQKLRLLDATKVSGRPAPSDREQAARERIAEIAGRGLGVLSVVEFLKTQFTEDEHVLDIPERYPRFEFAPDAEVVLTADQRSPTG